MVVVAQQCPRDPGRAAIAMREACSQKALAERAFFAFPRGGQQITGPSIHLARELARVWGNITYGVTELRRDDREGVSEMLAFAWDVETNTRSAQIFIVPHATDTKRGRKTLTELRDVYENNANQGARRVREAIFSVLPTYFTEEAVATLHKALEVGDGMPLADRIISAVNAFEGIGVTLDQLEKRIGKPRAGWSESDVARLSVVFQSIQRNEISVTDAFEPATSRVTADELARN